MADAPTLDTRQLRAALDGMDAAVLIYKLVDPEDNESLTVCWSNTANNRVAGTDLSAYWGLRVREAFPNAIDEANAAIADGIRDNESIDLGTVEYEDDNVRGVFRVRGFPLPDQCMALITQNVTEQRQAEALVDAQREELIELGTPLVEAWDGVLLLPLIGTLDTRRAADMTERLLLGIVEARARVAIIDVTGVPVIDTRVAAHLMQTIDAATMLGAKVIVTGIRPETAMTLTRLGVDTTKLNPQGRLKAGLAAALKVIGHQP